MPLVCGLWDLSYGPEDFVLLDGNLLHGVTGLRDCPGGGQSKRPELERFSAIAFSTFKRQEGMWKHGNFKGMWEETGESHGLCPVEVAVHVHVFCL